MMLDEYYTVIRHLPEPYSSELAALDPQIAGFVQELRLRVGQPLQFTIKGRLSPAHKFLPRAKACRMIEEESLRRCFAALCRYSVYAHEQELRQGYFTIQGGNRVGVAGVCSPGGLACVTSLNLRVARWITCTLPVEVKQALTTLSGGILVAGPPGSGKTTFLRSMITFLGGGDRIYCVVDERGELMAGDGTGFPKGIGQGGDVYTRYPKAEAISMALRCMNPQAIICDELGTTADLAALETGLASGVVFLASVHCEAGSMAALEKSPRLKRLLTMGAFSMAVFLSGSTRPGAVARVLPLDP